MGAMELWNHPDFFGYCDRWMTETHFDSLEISAIKDARGWDFSANWERQGACWDAVTNDMWKTYRNRDAVIRHFSPHLPKKTTGMVTVYNLKGQVVGNVSVTGAISGEIGRFFKSKTGTSGGVYLCKINGNYLRVMVR